MFQRRGNFHFRSKGLSLFSPGQGFQAELRHLQPATVPDWEKLLRSLGSGPAADSAWQGHASILNWKTQHKKKKKSPTTGGMAISPTPAGGGPGWPPAGKVSGPETRPARRTPSLPCRPLGMLRWCGGGTKGRPGTRGVLPALPSGALGGPGGSSGGGTWW